MAPRNCASVRRRRHPVSVLVLYTSVFTRPAISRYISRRNSASRVLKRNTVQMTTILPISPTMRHGMKRRKKAFRVAQNVRRNADEAARDMAICRGRTWKASAMKVVVISICHYGDWIMGPCTSSRSRHRHPHAMWAISKGGMTTKLLERDKTTFGKDRDRWNQPLLGLLSFYVQLSSRAGLLSLNDLPYLLPLTSTSSCFRGKQASSSSSAGESSSSASHLAASTAPHAHLSRKLIMPFSTL